MIDLKTVRKAWSLLDKQERRNAVKVLAVMIMGAVASASMIGSIFPFLSVLTDTKYIDQTPALKWVYEAGRFKSEYQFLLALGLASIAVIILSNLVLIFQSWVVARYTQMRIYSISRQLFENYLGQDYEFFIRKHTTALSTKILSEAEQVVVRYLWPFGELISATLTVLAILGTLMAVRPLVAAVTIGLFATMYAIVVLTTRRYVRKMGQVRAHENQRRFHIAGEAFGAIKYLKLLGREETYLDNFSKSSLNMARVQVGIGVVSQVPRYLIQIVAFGGVILLCLVLIDPRSPNDNYSLGNVLPLIGILAFAGQRLMPELQRIYQSSTEMTYGAALVERVYADLCGSRRHAVVRGTLERLPLEHTLVLDRISYTYPQSDRASLTETSLTMRSGERIGFVGLSGAGKTTLVDIMLGLLRPGSGTLSVDGVELTPQNLRSWQQALGYVPQDIFLSDSTLYENIAFGLREDEIDRDRVVHSAQLASLHDFIISQLPDGYSTRIGERGVRLSGGQRQRIGIARALYTGASLIIFDEATSSLDNLTEREVMAAIDALPENKTIVIIAHRLSTVKSCDRIVLLHAGKVEDVGSWDELYFRNQRFRELTASE